ncbi:MAG: 16S rRNA (uracil(1498)-N(3))-methyltransferase [Holosporales bacterium]|jgi:16S rRNA (uracil1498-N3)-methyltransferase|nr:16S rRNA (uracil(1498)-N(3))-methyltransferase [Holosporales bacterium]
MRHIPRVYCSNFRNVVFDIPISQVYRLISVLRLKESDNFLAFNKDEGEWLCSIESIKKNKVKAKKLESRRGYVETIRLALAFSPIKHNNMKFIIEKGTELGVTDFYPITSQYTNFHILIEKLESIAILATEQSERIDIPSIYEEIDFETFIMNLPCEFNWISAIERQEGMKSLMSVDLNCKNSGFIIGPEGGFSDFEKNFLMKKTTPVSLCRNILRSETAAIACLSVFNSKNV